MTPSLFLENVMRLFVVALSAFVVPFAILGFVGVIDPLGHRRGAEEAVEGWLSAQRDGTSGAQYWEAGGATGKRIPRIERWELVDVSSHQVRAVLWRNDRHGDPLVPEDYLFQLDSDGKDGGSDQKPRIVAWSHQNDPLSPRARKALECVEEWLVSERDGTDGSQFLSDKDAITSIDGIVRWTVVMPPQDSRKSSVNVLVQQRTADNSYIESTWNIGIEFQRISESEGLKPRIVRASNMSD